MQNICVRPNFLVYYICIRGRTARMTCEPRNVIWIYIA